MDITEDCVIYTPRARADGSSRPNKKRKTAQVKDNAQGPNHGFVPLYSGREKPHFSTLRSEAFESIWAAKAANLEKVLADANAETIDKITGYIAGTNPLGIVGQIPTGFVASGLATSSSGSMYDPIARKARELEGCQIICVPAAECPNLKAALKTIIRNGTDEQSGAVEEDEVVAHTKKRLLNYDLESLQDYLAPRKAAKCVLFFQNSEALDGSVLSELIDLLCSWQDRIPWIVLFEVAVSVDLFQEKFARRTVRQLYGTTFESRTPTEILDLMFLATTSPDDANPLYLGASTSKLLLDRQEEHIQSAKGFISALKYMYMTHFFSNPLSVLLAENPPSDLEAWHTRSIRNLASFVQYVENESTEDVDRANKLETSDDFLTAELPSILKSSRTSLLNLLDALRALHRIHQHTSSRNPLNWSSLYIKAMSGTLNGSPLYKELLLSVRKMPSDVMTSLLASLARIPSLALGSLPAELDKLVSAQSDDAAAAAAAAVILRSEHDPAQETTRTTVVSHKISLEKSKTALSPADQEYTRLSSRVQTHLRDYFTATLLSAVEIPLSEVLVFDAKGAVTKVLGAGPRAAVERALERPWGYLNCDCCGGGGGGGGAGNGEGEEEEEEGLKGTEPATSILWQLVQEAGNLINIEDLWRAFEAVVEGGSGGGSNDDDGDAGGEKDETNLALFYRALAELRYLGIIKNSRKRTDHVMKMRWKGL